MVYKIGNYLEFKMIIINLIDQFKLEKSGRGTAYVSYEILFICTPEWRRLILQMDNEFFFRFQISSFVVSSYF